jgi:hypothetical protein
MYLFLGLITLESPSNFAEKDLCMEEMRHMTLATEF